jgi:hypothetical protein
VNTIAELFYMAEVLGKQPRPKGPRLTVVTNAGGPGVIATDALIQDGGELAPISDAAMQQYNAALPPEWSHNNPVDVLGDASPERYMKAVDIALGDAGSNGLLVVLAPQALTDPTQIDVSTLMSFGLSLLVVCLIALVGFCLIAMAYWFAPALVVLNGEEPVTAMRKSFAACWRNLGAFLVYALIYIGLAIVATIPFGLGWFVLAPMIAGSCYAGWRTVFG